MNELSLWRGPEGINIPSELNEPRDIVSYANTDFLTVKQQQQILAAFSINAFDMGAEYAWRRAMTTLKESIASLGMDFIGEMLGREDITEFTSPDVALTDYTAILLADQLGIVGKKGILKLRQAQELLSHIFSKDNDEELNSLEAINIVRDSIQYVLGEKDVSVAVEFSSFRKRLQTETLKENDGQLHMLAGSSLFHIRTVLNVLLSNIRSTKGAKLEHTLANLNIIIPLIWDNLADKDKWNVGMAYRDVVAEGDNTSASGIKKALLKVKGFDFVPESLRSNTFKTAAKNIIDTHFSFNNFYNEPIVIKGLTRLGSVIPSPALQDCMDAYLLVYLGNYYGVSREAAPIAKKELLAITPDRWLYFFNNIIWKDELILNNLITDSQINRFSNLLLDISAKPLQDIKHALVQKFYDSIRAKRYNEVKGIRGKLLQNLQLDV